jgi:uncharacterized membrane protein YkvA (DUF1232 family)
MKFFHLIARFKNLKKKLGHAWKAFRHPGTPLIAKLLLSLGILGYVLMPMDALPDFILFFGLADDIVVIPLLVWIFMKFVPQEVLEAVNKSEQKK